MIINHGERKVTSTIDAERKRYTITDGNLIKLIQQQICAYSHPLKSVVREYVVNARDAMKLRGITKPIEVTTPNELHPLLEIRDYAGGLTEEETEDLLFSFGATGEYKPTSDRYVGGFGIGSKSAFGLAGSFLFVVYRNGVETVWSCMKDEDQFPTAAKLSQAATTEEDGILVKIPLTKAYRDEIVDVLQWMDVPVNLDGERVVPFEERVKCASGTVTIDGYEVTWLMPEKRMVDELTFIVGCGKIGMSRSSLPKEVLNNLTEAEVCISHRLILKIPASAVKLMTSREAFTYDDRTRKFLIAALNACVEGCYKKILENLTNAKNFEDAISALFGVRSLYSQYEFSDSAADDSSLLRQTLLQKLDAKTVVDHCVREIPLDRKAFPMLRISTPVYHRSGKLRWYTSYVTSDLYSQNSCRRLMRSLNKNTSLELHGMDDPGDAWHRRFTNEFLSLHHRTLNDEGRVLVESTQDKSGNSVAVLETLDWSHVELDIYPSNVKSFLREIRTRVEQRLNVDESDPVVISACCDEADAKKLEALFPEANHVRITNCAVRRVAARKVKSTSPARVAVGWEVFLKPREALKEGASPGEIVKACLAANTDFSISSKTPLRKLSNEKKRIVYIRTGLDNWKHVESIRRKIRVYSMALLLSNVDVAKRDGMPLIVVFGSETVPDIPGAKFVNDIDLERQENKWLFKLPEETRVKIESKASMQVDLIRNGYVLPIPSLVNIYNELAHPYPSRSDAEVLHLAFPLLRDLAPRLLGDRSVSADFRNKLKTILEIYEPPARYPLRFRLCAYSKMVTDIRTLVDGLFDNSPILKPMWNGILARQTGRRSWENFIDDIEVLVRHHNRNRKSSDKGQEGKDGVA